MRSAAKDDAAWRRTDASLRAEPKQVRDARRRDALAGREVQRRGGIQLSDAEALMARFAASEAMYG